MIERFEELRERLQEQYEALSPRDQLLALGLVSGLALVLAAMFTFSLHNVVVDKASRVRAAKDNLEIALDMAVEHGVLSGKIAAAEARMQTFRPSQVNTYLETWANNAGVLSGLKKVQETGTDAVGNYKERSYQVDVQRAELEGLVRFLYAIETSPYPVRVKQASFHVVESRDERLLDLNLELVTYAKDGGGEG